MRHLRTVRVPWFMIVLLVGAATLAVIIFFNRPPTAKIGGRWQLPGGQVMVSETADGYVGRLTRDQSISDCAYRRGQLVWRLHATGSDTFTGQALICGLWRQATWHIGLIGEASFGQLAFCSRRTRGLPRQCLLLPRTLSTR